MKITMELSAKSVGEAIKQLRQYEKHLDEKVDELCRRLAEEGVEAAKANVPVDTGWLQSGISVERVGDKDYLVVSAGKYAAFVEFGTGVVGQGSYAGELPSGYTYNDGQTPAAHDPMDPDAWFYYDAYGVRRRTKGHAAQPYMLDTAEYIRASVMEIAKEVFAA